MDITSMMIYVCVQLITPGPNNMMSLYLGAKYGIRRAKDFFLGTCTGFAIKMVLCAMLNLVLAELIPGVTIYLKWIGAAYLLYLALHILFTYKKEAKNAMRYTEASFSRGIMLQVFNVKSWLMCLSVFSIYVIPFTSEIKVLLLWSLVFCVLMVACTLIWALGGAAIQKFFQKHRLLCSIIMAALLIYCAVMAIL